MTIIMSTFSVKTDQIEGSNNLNDNNVFICYIHG